MHSIYLRFFPFFLIFGLLLPAAKGQSARKVTVSGYIKDAESGQQILGASVVETRLKKGVVSNAFGFFSLTLDADSVFIRVSMAGYSPRFFALAPKADTLLQVDLEVYSLGTVEIVAENQTSIQEQTTMSSIDIPIEQIKKIPALLGEVDVIKAIQLMPGVQSGSEGSTGLYVRGGGPDQNLILLDDVPLYYVSHLGGFFSVFNADAISSVRLIKGGFPARYGGRLSSVVDIRMREGNLNKYQVEGSIGIISSKISVEGPIKKGKTSFMVSARRTYLDLLTRPITALAIRSGSEGEARGSTGYYFYDVNAKVNHIIGEKDRLYLSTYFGDDRIGFNLRTDYEEPNSTDYERTEVKSRTGWGNQLVALRWNHLWSPRLFSNLSAIYTNYRFSVTNDLTSDSRSSGQRELTSAFLGYSSGVRDFGLRYDWDFYPNPNHSVKFGVHATRHTFNPGLLGFSVRDSSAFNLDTTLRQDLVFTWEFSGYIEDEWKVNNRLNINAGLRYDFYATPEKNFQMLQPRLSARYLINDWISAKASFARMLQPLHLLSNSGLGLPIDLWVPATGAIAPQSSWQVAAGFAATPWDNGLEFSVEGYYKHMDGLIEYKEGTNFFNSFSGADWQKSVESGGTGEAYGAEFLLQKKNGKTTGWIGYTLSWNFRQFDNINGGLAYPYRFDRRHDASLVVSHQFNKRVALSGTWVYGTGNALSLATGSFETLVSGQYGTSTPGYNFFPSSLSSAGSGFFFGGLDVNVYDQGRNNFRMEDYHRLDISLELTREKRWGERSWSIGFYNLYARQNPYTYFISQEFNVSTNQRKLVLTRFSLFPFPIPFISYQFKIK